MDEHILQCWNAAEFLRKYLYVQGEEALPEKFNELMAQKSMKENAFQMALLSFAIMCKSIKVFLEKEKIAKFLGIKQKKVKRFQAKIFTLTRENINGKPAFVPLND